MLAASLQQHNFGKDYSSNGSDPHWQMDPQKPAHVHPHAVLAEPLSTRFFSISNRLPGPYHPQPPHPAPIPSTAQTPRSRSSDLLSRVQHMEYAELVFLPSTSQYKELKTLASDKTRTLLRETLNMPSTARNFQYWFCSQPSCISFLAF